MTIIAKEYPRKYDSKGNDPYYPIPTIVTVALYKQYEEQAEQFHNLILCGRLADYRYYNMDQAMKRVLELVKSIK